MELIYYRHAKNMPALSIHPQTIGYFDLTLVMEGELRYFVNDAPVTLQKNQAVLIPPDSRRARDRSEHPAEYFSFNFYLSPEERERFRFPLQLDGFLDSRSELLIHYLSSFGTEIQRGNALIAHLLCCLLEQFRERYCAPKYSDALRKLLSFMEAHSAEPLSLAGLSAATFFSPSYIELLFRKELNSSAIRYLLELRLEKAKRLLYENGYQVKEIAELCGFSDCNYFVRIFHKHVGMTPLQYRKQYAEFS